MHATKRKFHNILNSISNSSSTTLSDLNFKQNASTITLPTDVEFQSKKRRVQSSSPGLASPKSGLRPKSSYIPTSKLAGTRLDYAKVSLKARRPSEASVQEPDLLPNYAPWDRGQFLGRLSTFRQVDKWSAKPALVNEVQWARRGWSCVGKERVRCVGGCDKEVFVKLEKSIKGIEKPQSDEEAVKSDAEAEDWDKTVGAEIVEKYAAMITTEHDINCPWQTRGCDDTIYRLPLSDASISVPALQTRYKSLLQISSELPDTLSVPPDLEFASLLECLPLEFSSLLTDESSASLTTPTPINNTALTLALFGWHSEGNYGHINGLITCSACFRRLGLWLFKPPINPSSTVKTESASPIEEDEYPSMSRLDVVGEHREYCPWVNVLSQNGKKRSLEVSNQAAFKDNLCGWQALSEILKSEGHFHRRTKNHASVFDSAPQGQSPGVDESASGGATAQTSEIDRDGRDAKDKERWMRLKMLRKVFDVRSGKK
ncbi:MAG: hypothetical protein M1829_006057, partial [Trizodia sp. TS-e1964]